MIPLQMGYSMVRRNARAIGRYSGGAKMAWRLGQYAGRALRRFRRGGGGGGSSSSAKAKAVGSLSEQRDVTNLYRRKRAPRRVRRAARKFTKRFMYTLDKTQGMKTCVITNAAQFSGSPTGLANGQQTIGITMYGYNTNSYASNIDLGNGDMPWIFARENGAYPTAASGTRYLRFRSCTMNYSIQNTWEQGVYMDIYFVIARKSNGSTSDPAAEWNEQIAIQNAGNMPTAITTNQYYGLTPFDAPGFGRYWLIKSRKRVFIQPAEIYSFQQRDAGNYVLNMSDVLDIKLKQNLTEGVILVFHNPVTDTVTTPGTIVPGGWQVQVTCTKTYHYSETSASTDAIGV
ncbi:putative capsid protein [Odonata-associated circular virus-15]|uniref:Putative capsid protein n=1 Tax=Odonata-associated circular virus-15 TaxID=1592115 RepID=A0A0B4UFU2_9VIRU|nr:putative capsid protein [Odonata-associated circular virus-15]AJD07487.1 putative capsid protein [Odonata-associated circular virus-15]